MRLLRITAAHDVGRAINPTLAEGQIEGGIAQGIGMALMEEYLPGRTENLHDYLIPTIGDVPEIVPILIEEPDPEGPFGAKGLGEHVLIPTAPAILNAIRHATGAEIDRLPALPHRVLAAIRAAEGAGGERAGKIRCDACPVMCYIAPGQTGACDRYANVDGRIVRSDPLTVLDRTLDAGGRGGALRRRAPGTARSPRPPTASSPASAPAPPIPTTSPRPSSSAARWTGADVVTVVTEAIFSYCGVKVKIDTDRHLGPEAATVRAGGEAVGHVTTGEYGSQMLSLGGVEHLTGGSKAEGRATCAALLALCNREPVELTVDGGATVTVQAGRPPVVDGVVERRMRVGCGSATIGMFAAQWQGLVDEVVVVDDHITGVVSEHQAGKVLGWAPTGIRIKGRRSTPGRYFRVSEPGSGWGGTRLERPAGDPRAVRREEGRAARADPARWSPPPARNTPTTSSTPT